MPRSSLIFVLFIFFPLDTLALSHESSPLSSSELPAWPSAVAISESGDWYALALVSDPSWVEIWNSNQRQGIFYLQKPYRSHALHISDNGEVTVGLSKMASRLPFVSILQLAADGSKKHSCHADLAGPFINRPTQLRGVRYLSANDLIVFLITIEGAVQRINLADCRTMSLLDAAQGDTEQKGEIISDHQTVTAFIENKNVGSWTWEGTKTHSPHLELCTSSVKKLVRGERIRQQVNSRDCRVSLLRTPDKVFKCEAGSCQLFRETRLTGDNHE